LVIKLPIATKGAKEMKRILSGLKMSIKINIVFLLFFMLPMSSFALNDSDFKIDGKGTIIKYEGWDQDIAIPMQINGIIVSSIGNEAFMKSDLKSLVIPDSVETIGNSAFEGNSLTNITIGKNVVLIGNNAFANNKLTTINIPDNVQTIGSYAFSNNQITEVSLGKNLVSIARDSFSNNDLKKITLPNDCLFEVGPWISCDDDTYNQRFAYEYMCNDRKAGTYNISTDWGEIKESNNFRYIETTYGLSIVEYTGAENRLAIPDQIEGKKVKYIARIAKDYSNSQITMLRIPDGVSAIGQNAFCGNLLTTLDIPNSVRYIGPGAFCDNKLTTLNIGNSVTYIGAGAFSQNKLSIVSIPDSVEILADGRQNSDNYGGVFSKNNLTNVSLGKGLFYIGSYAFANASFQKYNALKSIIIPNSVKHIGEGAFCYNELSTVIIPDNVVRIGTDDLYGDGAFSHNKLTSVVLNSKLEFIGSNSFSDNELSSVIVPQNVKTIGCFAFGGNQLTTIAISGKPKILLRAFENSPYTQVKQITVTIPGDLDLDPEHDIVSEGFYRYYINNGNKTGIYTLTQDSKKRFTWTYKIK
jgi:hypothetical protein